MEEAAEGNHAHWTHEERLQQEAHDGVHFEQSLPQQDMEEADFDCDGIRLTLCLQESPAMTLLKQELPSIVSLSSSHQHKLSTNKDRFGLSTHMLVSGGTNADRWRLWIHRSGKVPLIKKLKRPGSESDKISRFIIAHESADILLKTLATLCGQDRR